MYSQAHQTTETDVETYKIVRMYFKGGKRVLDTGLTLEEAQEHCRDPETSSRTCTRSANVQRTQRKGPWFDGYEQE
jgi:hypothetical protein